MKPWIILLTAALVAGATALQSAPSVLYIAGVSVTDLGTLGGAESTALDINDAGDIVGWSSTSLGVKHAFLWQGGMMQDIGGSVGATAASEATAINNWSEVVGSGQYQGRLRALRWDNGLVFALPDYAGTWQTRWSVAAGINDNGAIVGTIDVDRGGTQPALWDGTYPALLPTHATFPYDRNGALDINNGRTVVGYSVTAFRDAARWVPLPSSQWSQQHIPAPSNIPGRPDLQWYAGLPGGINDRGHIVGHFDVADIATRQVVGQRAFRWDGVSASSQDLGWLPTGVNSQARDINYAGFITGYADTVTTFPFPGSTGLVRKDGFLWGGAWGLYALPKLPGSLECEAFSLNNRERFTGLIQIVGYCTVSGKPRAVRWDVTVSSRML